MNKKQLFLNTLKWGFALWLFGYVLGFVLFAFVPANLIGWAILPFGVAVTLWVLFKKIERESLQCYVALGVFWTLLAIILDYIFIVKLLKPVDGYYKSDVYVYYMLTFILSIIVGWWKFHKVAGNK